MLPNPPRLTTPPERLAENDDMRDDDNTVPLCDILFTAMFCARVFTGIYVREYDDMGAGYTWPPPAR